VRLWSLHPKYLDAKGLTALWREALLARKVLRGKTKGYKNHPQLERFKKQSYPLAAIESFLEQVYRESCIRGYCFDKKKIEISDKKVSLIKVTQGQIEYEFKHLRAKLENRDRKKFDAIKEVTKIRVNPVFKVVTGPVETWEKQ